MTDCTPAQVADLMQRHQRRLRDKYGAGPIDGAVWLAELRETDEDYRAYLEAAMSHGPSLFLHTDELVDELPQ